MKILPFFKEDDGLKCSSSISLNKNMGALSEEDAKIVSKYMESCAVIDELLSNIKDPITNWQTIPSKTWSDGLYVWDSTHIHYIKNYRARLPEEFINHAKKMAANGFDGKLLNRELLRSEFESILEKVVSGDESHYAKYENNFDSPQKNS